MKKTRLLIAFLLFILFFTACTEDKTDLQSTKLGKLILNQENIKTIEIIKGSAKQTCVTITDPTTISTIIIKVKEIPVNRLSKSADTDFMSKRAKDSAVLNVMFYSDDPSLESLKGEFFVWPDGTIYTIEVSSMRSSQRTVSYLSDLKYPQIYQMLYDSSSTTGISDQLQSAEQFVKSQGYQILMNSGKNYSLQLPGTFDEVRNGVQIGELLKKRNEISRQNGYDFSGYLGKQVMLVTYGVENEQKEFKNINLILDGNKIAGFWIDDHEEPSDFNLIVKAFQPE